MDNNSTLTNETQRRARFDLGSDAWLGLHGHKASGHRLATRKNDAIASCKKLQTKLQTKDQMKG